MVHNYREPVYTIGIVAKSLRVCQATLRIWERKGLIKPDRLGKNRFYSRCDMDRLEYIKQMIQTEGINIKGAKAILSTTKCWETKNCTPKEKKACPVFINYGHA